jgi:hypothetical protein
MRDTFTTHYITAMLWAETDNGDTPLDENYDGNPGEFTDRCYQQILADCKAFQEQYGHLWTDDSQAAHDFWLTRQRHGCGFWARPEIYGDNTDALTDAAHEFGEFELYITDDKKIDFCG